MSFSYEEVEDMVSSCKCCCNKYRNYEFSHILDLFVKAGKAANKYNKPVVLDPVGVFRKLKREESLLINYLNEVNFDC